jgi:hypothetical protein
VVAFLAVVLFVALPSSPEVFWESLAARNIQNDLDLRERPRVDLRSDGTLAALSGRFTGGTVVVRNLDLGDPNEPRPERLRVDLQPFEVDVLGSLRSGVMRAERPVPGTVEVTLSEGEVRRLAEENARGFPVTGIQLERGRAVVGSEVALFGSELPVSVEGAARVRGRTLVFQPEQVTAAGVPLPAELNRAVLENADFEYPIPLPDDVRITGGEVMRNRLVLNGEVDDLFSADLSGA